MVCTSIMFTNQCDYPYNVYCPIVSTQVTSTAPPSTSITQKVTVATTPISTMTSSAIVTKTTPKTGIYIAGNYLILKKFLFKSVNSEIVFF